MLPLSCDSHMCAGLCPLASTSWCLVGQAKGSRSRGTTSYMPLISQTESVLSGGSSQT